MKRNDAQGPSLQLEEASLNSFSARLLARYGNGERLLTPKDVAELYQVSQATLERWRREGNGPIFLKFGRGRTALVRYRLDDILEHVDQATRRSTSDSGRA
jgi:transposase